MPPSTYLSTFKKHIKGAYCQWLLVCLPSGKWTPVWAASLQNENLLWAILTEDKKWFGNQLTFAQPDIFDTKEDALRVIVDDIEEEIADNPTMENFLAPDLKKARLALLRSQSK